MLVDLHNKIDIERFIDPANTTNNTAIVSQIIDTANFGSLEMVIMMGSLADDDATFVILVEDGDDSGLSDAAAVADAFLLGTEAGAAPLFSNDNEVRKIGYIGPKRYVRMTITPAANTGDAYFAGVALRGNPRKGPQSSQS